MQRRSPPPRLAPPAPRPAPFAAARTFELASRTLGGRPRRGSGELLAAWLADSVLAQKLKWPFALPLLAAPLFASAGRRAPTDSAAPKQPASCSPGPRAPGTPATSPPSSHDGRTKLAEAAPKLRAKGARAALQALLDQDLLAAATPIAGLSERGTRRLFERLAALGAIRELTGRATFRLYGL